MNTVQFDREHVEDGSLLKYDARTGEWKAVPSWVAFRSVNSAIHKLQEEILILSNHIADQEAEIKRLATIIKEGLQE